MEPQDQKLGGNPSTVELGTMGLNALDDKQTGSAPASPGHQDPFGDESKAVVQYRTVTWCGILINLAVGVISIYTGYIFRQLKHRRMQIYSMADARELLVGHFSQRVLGFGQQVFLVFVMASHALTFSIMMNVLADHSNCTILYAAIGVLVSFLLTLPRRLERLSHLSSVGFISIVGAVMTPMAGVSLAKMNVERLAFLTPAPIVHDACLAVANIVFAYAGHVAFFTLFSELQDIDDFPKALALLQTSEMILYTAVAIVIYVYVGPEVTSPALNSAAQLFRRISYGIAIPTVYALQYRGIHGLVSG
ncbi:uncharacterized protein N7459_003702 [Penicillium hispanicum]|uniref:uncharacterized protein n=1 Tax=Penicillium hispanicum TaxID=1080232 RepID=UPI0025406AB8|nr:uncharacterized protein N7459_003702 [Penicillium hispanicum]KAJ5587937.1 hypothetical protein N7459_003702 [Penicillium hispanicum]